MHPLLRGYVGRAVKRRRCHWIPFIASWVLAFSAVPQLVAQPTAPALAIDAGDDGTYLLSWTLAAPDYLLESRADFLAATPWIAAPQVPQVVGGRFVVPIVAVDSARFYRLRQQSPETNQPPVLGSVGNQTVPLGTDLQIRLTAADPEGQPLRYSAAPLPLPGNARLDAATGLFTYRPGASEVGSHVLSFMVSDGASADSEMIEIVVLPALVAGITSISGRLLDTTDVTTTGVERPVAGVTVSLLGGVVKVTSAADGRFLLSGVTSGKQVLDLDTSTALPAPDGSPYAGFREEFNVIVGVNNVVTRPFYLPRLDRSSLTQVNPAQTTTVMNANLGTTLVVPANTAKLGGTNFTGQLSISLVPQALAPAALPSFLNPGMLITIQPVGVSFATPAPVTFPNIDELPPGTETDLWSLDAGTGQFVVVGTGRVTADGRSITTISGGIRNTDWHAPLPPAPPLGPPPDDSDPDDDDPGDDCEEEGSIITLSNGRLREEFFTPPYYSLGQARAVRFVYDSRRAFPFPVIPDTITIPVRSAVPPRVSYHLSVAGVEQGNETFVDTSALNENVDETIRVAAGFDATSFATGTYPYTLRRTSHFKVSRISSDIHAHVSIVNEIASPFGAGWGIDGLQRLVPNEDGSVLLFDGDGTTIFFDRGDRRDLLVVNTGGNLNNGILRYHATTGELLGYFVQPGAGGLTGAHNPTLGPDGNLYVISEAQSAPRILRFNGVTGEFIDVFVDARTRHASIAQMAFGPDGNLYADLGGPQARQVMRYSGVDGSFLGIAAEGDGIQRACGIAFGPDGNLYVADQDRFATTRYDRILRFNGGTGQFIDEFVHPGDLDDTCPFEFGGDGNIYIADQRTHDIRRFNGTNGVFLGVFAAGEPIANPVPYYARSGPDGLLYVVNDLGIHRYRDNGTNGVFVDTFIAGNAGFPNFLPERPPGSTVRFDSPPGDYSILIRNSDGTYTRTLPNGSQFQFATSGLLVATSDRNSNTTRYQYDPQFRLTEIVDPMGLKTTFDYSGVRLDHVVDPAGRRTRLRHDAGGDLVQVTLPDGRTRSYGYDSRHLLTTETDPLGFTKIREFDHAGRFVRSRLPDGTIRQGSNAQAVGLVDLSQGQGSTENPVAIVRPTQAQSTFQAPGTGTTRYVTGAFGELRERRDSANVATSAESDLNGNPTLLTLSEDESYRFAADAQGNLTQVVDVVLGATYAYQHEGPHHRLSQAVDPLGNVSTFAYDPQGNLVSSSTPQGRSIAFGPRARGLLSTVTNQAGVVAEITNDDHGNLVRMRQVGGDAERLATFERSPEGYVTYLVDPAGRAFGTVFDLAGRVITQVLPDGGRIDYSYDSAGRLTSITPPGRRPHYFEDSPVTGLFKYRPPTDGGEDGSILFGYVGSDLLQFMRRSNGRTVVLDYDLAGGLTRVTFDRGQVQFTRDSRSGRITGIAAPGGLDLKWQYLGGLKSEETLSGPVRGSWQMTYDKMARPVSVRVNGLEPTELKYDRDGAIEKAGDIVFVRDARTGFLIRSTLGIIDTTWNYNAFGEPTNTMTQVGGAPIYSATHQRDALGRIVHAEQFVQGERASATYFYDPAGHLVRVDRDGGSTNAYGYDANGNRVSGPRGFSATIIDAQDRLILSSLASYSYNSPGDLQLKMAGGRSTRYEFDSLGNLLRADLPDGTVIEYLIDGLNRRVGRSVNGSLTRGFLFEDGIKILAEFDGANQEVSRFVYGPGVNVPEYMVRQGRRYRLVTDHVGSVRLVVDAESGAVVQRLDYDEFGVVLADSNPGFTPFGFAGGLYDSATGLVRFGGRDYDPDTGRWLTKDAGILLNGDTNPYVYVHNDPVNFVDPVGSKGFKVDVPNSPNVSSVPSSPADIAIAAPKAYSQSYSVNHLGFQRRKVLQLKNRISVLDRQYAEKQKELLNFYNKMLRKEKNGEPTTPAKKEEEFRLTRELNNIQVDRRQTIQELNQTYTQAEIDTGIGPAADAASDFKDKSDPLSWLGKGVKSATGQK